MTKTVRKIPTTKRFQRIRAMAVVNLVLLVANLTSYFFVSRFNVYPVLAKEELLCMKICAAGTVDCTFGPCANPPTVSTASATSITATTATGGGEVTSDGGDTITERGVALATTPGPTTANTTFTAAGTTGEFTVSMTGLTAATSYYARAYATNAIGTAYGGVTSFTTLSSGATPTPTPTPTPRPAGGVPGALNRPFTTPLGLVPQAEISRVLVAEEAALPVYVKFDKLHIPTVGNIEISQEQPLIIPYVDTFITFEGKTNIKNAVVVITLSSPQNIYATTFADSQGRWTWTTPEVLLPDRHNLVVLAMSPSNASVKETTVIEFLIEKLVDAQSPSVAETPVVGQPPIVKRARPPTSVSLLQPDLTRPRKFQNILPPTPQPPIEVTPELYALDLRVTTPEGVLTPTNQLDVRTEIINLEQQTAESVLLTFTVLDARGNRVLVQQKTITVKDTATDTTRLVTSSFLRPGDYLIRVELQVRDTTYIATKRITIQPHRMILPAGLTITTTRLQQGLLGSSVFLALSFAMMISLLFWEFQKSKKAIQITEKDLWTTGDIT